MNIHALQWIGGIPQKGNCQYNSTQIGLSEGIGLGDTAFRDGARPLSQEELVIKGKNLTQQWPQTLGLPNLQN